MLRVHQQEVPGRLMARSVQCLAGCDGHRSTLPLEGEPKRYRALSVLFFCFLFLFFSSSSSKPCLGANENWPGGTIGLWGLSLSVWRNDDLSAASVSGVSWTGNMNVLSIRLWLLYFLPSSFRPLGSWAGLPVLAQVPADV